MMTPNDMERDAGTAMTGVTRSMVLIAIFATLGIRLLHLASAVTSPFTYHLGADEGFYLDFGRTVAGIAHGDPTELAFMDPAYGYLLGLIFKAVGPNLFVVFLVQIVLDTVTAGCIFLIGREFGRSRGGLYAAVLYGLTSTAVLYSTTLLKATWVANYMTLWVLGGLLLLRTRKALPWLLFGLFCGYGVALRSNLLTMAAIAALLLPWLRTRMSERPLSEAARSVVSFAAGLVFTLVVLAIRNDAVSQKFSPLPNNGGIVLHQLYNPGNPRALNWAPAFVAYSNPIEIWRGYAREAEKRAGRSLTPAEIGRYWRGEAFAYIGSNPLSVARNMFVKLSLFFAYFEIPNNRSLADERMFSPVLRVLPSPFAWLFALGVPGLVLLLYRDRRALLPIAPVVVAAATAAVFFAEARFRLHAVPMLALGAGLFLDDLHAWFKSRQLRQGVLAAVGAALLGMCSTVLGQYVARPETAWDRIVWGYMKMGKADVAKSVATKVIAEQPGNAAVHEALGFIAAGAGDDAGAVEHYRRAIALRPESHVAHYNLAMRLAKLGKTREAAEHAAIAEHIAPLPEYQQLLAELNAKHAGAVKTKEAAGR